VLQAAGPRVCDGPLSPFCWECECVCVFARYTEISPVINLTNDVCLTNLTCAF